MCGNVHKYIYIMLKLGLCISCSVASLYSLFIFQNPNQLAFTTAPIMTLCSMILFFSNNIWVKLQTPVEYSPQKKRKKETISSHCGVLAEPPSSAPPFCRCRCFSPLETSAFVLRKKKGWMIFFKLLAISCPSRCSPAVASFCLA